MDTAGVDRRKAKLSSQISVLSKKRNNDGLDALVGLTVDAVLGQSQELCKPSASSSSKPKQKQTTSRTLLDIISDEESGSAYRGLVSHNSIKNKKKSKKSIKDRLKFRRPGSSWSSSTSRPVPTSDFPINNRRIQQISGPTLVDGPSLRSLSSNFSIKRIIVDDEEEAGTVGKSDSTTETPSDDHAIKLNVPKLKREESRKVDLTMDIISEKDAGKSNVPMLKRESITDEEKSEGIANSSDDDDDDEEEGVVKRENVDDAGSITEAHPAEENELKSASEAESEPEEEEERNACRPLISEPTSDNEDDDEEEEEDNENESGPMMISESMVEMPTVSLMALLEESGRRAEDDEEEEEEEEEEEYEENEEGEEYVCTVCMVKHRGLGFVPCGHSFCRLCTKQLWVSRGNCPLCIAYILEILDIF